MGPPPRARRATNEEFLRLGAFHATAPRDVALADYTLWILGRLERGERAVYWATTPTSSAVTDRPRPGS